MALKRSTAARVREIRRDGLRLGGLTLGGMLKGDVKLVLELASEIDTLRAEWA